MVELLNELIGVGGGLGLGLSPIDGQTAEGDRWLETLVLSEPPKEDTTATQSTVVSHSSSSVRGKSARSLVATPSPSLDILVTDSEPATPSPWPMGRADSCDTLETSGTLIRVDSLCSSSSSSAWPCDQENNNNNSNPQDISDEFSRWAQRRTNAPLLVDIPPAQGFEQPQLGFRGAMSLMGELSKAVLRLKDDLFVFKFADPTIAIPTTRRQSNSVPMKAHRSSETLDTLNDDDDEEEEEEAEEDLRDLEEEGDLEEEEEGGEENGDMDICLDNNESVDCPVTANSSCSVSLSSMPLPSRHPGTQPAVRRRGRKKGTTTRATTYLRHAKLRETEREFIEESCLALLRDIRPDGSDPDPLFSSPLVDCRHTFLEMCQFRHFQFDTLRRAKHSSLMILHHLHSPENKRLRPTCTTCANQLLDIRWHCELCANYDICESCYGSTTVDVPTHEHLLTPFRVTFV